MVRASEQLKSLEDCDVERAERSDVLPPKLETRQTPLVWSGRVEVSDFFFCKVSPAQSLKRVHVTQPWVQRAQWISVRPTHGHPPTLNLLDWDQDIFKDTSSKARIKFKYIFGNWYLTE